MSQRVAIYSRVSSSRQTVANQVTELRAWAERCGHKVVAEYEDHAISGAKGRDQRPAFDRVLKGAVRREFDIIAVWSSDRLGRSLPHLIEVLQTIRDIRAGLYIHTRALDTTTPAGRSMFGLYARTHRRTSGKPSLSAHWQSDRLGSAQIACPWSCEPNSCEATRSAR